MDLDGKSETTTNYDGTNNPILISENTKIIDNNAGMLLRKLNSIQNGSEDSSVNNPEVFNANAEILISKAS